jgi:hypothetical protein
MKAIGAININSIKIQELDRNTDSLSTGTIFPPTGSGIFPAVAGPILKFKA